VSTQTPDSRRRRATPRQIARAVRRGTVPANLRPRPPMPHTPASSHANTSLSIEPVDPPAERTAHIEEVEEPVRRWGPALFLQEGVEDDGHGSGGFGWLAGLRERLPRSSPYSWRERDWGAEGWVYRIRVLPIAAAVLIALLVVGTFAFVIASRAASGAANGLHGVTSSNSATPVSPGGIILQQQPSGAPTPAAPTYTVGAWVTDYAPASGGTEQVYVRVSNDSNPVGHIPVRLSVSWSGGGTSYGPALTNSYGLASFQVSVSGPPGQPEFVTASVTVGGSTVTGDTTFVPGGGGAGPAGGGGDSGGGGNGHGHGRGAVSA